VDCWGAVTAIPLGTGARKGKKGRAHKKVMRLFLKALLLASLVLNLWLGWVLSKRMLRHDGVSTGTINPFAITNLDGVVSGDGYIVVFRDGKYWWTVDGEMISMNAGVNQEMTLRLDKATGRVKSTTIELIDAKGQYCYFTDMNADGIPDKKRVVGEADWQIFFGGEFVPSFAPGESRYIIKAGTNLPVTFDGTRWKAVE
jgi:hypothetical protein